MKAISYVCLFVGVAWLTATVNGQDAASWKAGAAAIDITPDGPVWMAGYGSRNKPSQGIAQRIYAKASGRPKSVKSSREIASASRLRISTPR